MAGCDICGVESNLQYRCNYCDNEFCSDHRLPEKHDCPGLIIFQYVGPKWFHNDTGLPKDEIPDDLLAKVANELDLVNSADDADTAEIRKTESVLEEVGRNTKKSTDHVSIGDDLTESGSESYTTFEPEHTVGTSIDPDYESSPDVNLDGSIKGIEDESVDDESDRPKQRTISKNFIIYSVIFLMFVLVLVFLL